MYIQTIKTIIIHSYILYIYIHIQGGATGAYPPWISEIYNGVLGSRERTMSPPPSPVKKEQIFIPHSGVWTYFWLHPYMNMIMYSFNIEMYVTDLVQGKRIVLKLYIKISLHFMTIIIRKIPV